MLTAIGAPSLGSAEGDCVPISSDLLRFALGSTPIRSDLFRFAPFCSLICSDLFSEQIRTNPFCKYPITRALWRSLLPMPQQFLHGSLLLERLVVLLQQVKKEQQKPPKWDPHPHPPKDC